MCSNASTKRLKAAEIFEIAVVNPLWVENCLRSGTRVSEADFAVGQELGIGSTSAATAEASTLSSLQRKSIEPVVDEEKSLRRLSSPHYSSSQKEESLNLAKLQKMKSKSQNPKTAKGNAKAGAKSSDSLSTIIPDMVIDKENDRVENVKTTTRNVEEKKKEKDLQQSRDDTVITQLGHDADSSRVEETTSKEAGAASSKRPANPVQSVSGTNERKELIPVRGYKEIKKVILPASLKSRRSERICDNEEELETLENILKMDVDAALPIVRLADSPPEEVKESSVKNVPVGDNKVIKHVEAAVSKSKQNIVDSTGTENNEKKAVKSAKIASKKSENETVKDVIQKPSTDTGNLKTVSTDKQVSGKKTVGPVIIENNGTGVTSADLMARTNVERTDIKKRDKIVIAVSGFDESGEKETILNGLKHLIDALNQQMGSKQKLSDISKSSKNKCVTNSASSSSSSSSSSNSDKSNSSCDTNDETKVSVLGSEDDPYGLECTLVILESSSSK